MPYRLIPDNVSHDTVEALETLLALAKTGDITGFAYACTLRKNRYITNVAGYCYRNLTFTRGMCVTLMDELGRMIKHRDFGETR